MSQFSTLDEKTERALKAHDLDLCEHFVLCTAQGESPAPRSRFAEFCKDGGEGDPRGTFTIDEYEAALVRLLSRGLLVTATAADLQRDAASPGPKAIYELDDVCFSEEGKRLHAEVIREILGKDPRPKVFGVLKR